MPIDTTIVSDTPTLDNSLSYAPVEKFSPGHRAGYVYLIRAAGTNVYKIGSSENPPRRMKTLQSKRKYQLEIIATIYADDCRRLERRYHMQLVKYKIAGEWFLLPQSEVDVFKSLAVQS